MRRALKKGLHTSIILSWYCLPKIRPRASHLYLHGRCEILGYIMNQMYTIALGGLLVLSPLSMAMAAEKTVFQLPKINVVANLVEQANTDTLAAVTVIEREEIERKQFSSLQDLLRTIPSISYVNTGGLGQTTGLSIRGTNSNAVLVMVDGQKLASATTGQTAIEHLPIDQIERIEVVRGPRSSLYGSEAVGGVIQIYTRKGTADGIKPYASLKYGSHETYDANVGVDIRKENTWMSASLAGLKTQGLDVLTSKTEEDKDGYKNVSASLKAGHQFNELFAIEVNALHVQGEAEYDGGVNPENEIQQNVYGAGLTFTPNDIWTSKFNVGISQDKYETFDSKKTTGKFDTEKQTVSWLNTIEFNKNHSLVAGVDYLNDKVTSSTDYDEKERNNIGLFTQYIGQFNAVNLQAALRSDDNEQFGQHTTGNIALGYQFNDYYNAYMSYGTAFRSPTFNDLYYPGWANPNLEPEESENIEIGFKGSQLIDWELIGFVNKIDNLIANQNNGQAKIKGIELSLGQNFDALSWNVNYTYQDPENQNPNAKGKQLTFKPAQLFNASLDYKVEDWTIGGSVHAEEKRYTDALNTAKLAGFAIADVRVAYQVTPEFSVQAKLANMFDKEYYTNNSWNGDVYRQDGRTAWVTLRYAMK